MIEVWAAILILFVVVPASFLVGSWYGTGHGYEKGAADYEHHLRYPVTESHRHYPAGRWDQYRPPQ